MSLSPHEQIPTAELKLRPAGATELSWCKAVTGGTGITVLALLFSKPPDIQNLQNALRKLQIAHPILNSKIQFNPESNSFSYLIHPNRQIEIQPYDLQSTAQILQTHNPSVNSPFQFILEHELNNNTWQNPDLSSSDVFFASVYALQNDTWVVTLRLHTSVCDRASAVALVREFLGGVERELCNNVEVSLGIEEYIPSGLANKPFWARGVDVLGYSLNSFRFANLSFKDAVSPRVSCVVRLEMNEEDTGRILSNCESREIKLCAVLASAAFIACHSSKGFPDDRWEKYAIVTLLDCRSILDPVLSSDHIVNHTLPYGQNRVGFYHSAVLNTHDVNGRENLFDLAKRIYTSFSNAKKNNKHFSDMADINFLMCKAIENPRLTPSASLRTSLISVFEDPMVDNSTEVNQEIGLQDFIGCASVHGVGPSIAIFDTIRDGKLDCACVYPSPLHLREQMQEFVDEMKRILLDGTT